MEECPDYLSSCIRKRHNSCANRVGMDAGTTFSGSHVLRQTKLRLLDLGPGFATKTQSATAFASLTTAVDRITVRGANPPELVLQMNVL
jgi:hypothetical protein